LIEIDHCKAVSIGVVRVRFPTRIRFQKAEKARLGLIDNRPIIRAWFPASL